MTCPEPVPVHIHGVREIFVTNYDRLVLIIGPEKAAVVSASMAGKKIVVNKKPFKVYLEYCKKKPYYDRLKVALSAHILGCSIRYFKKLRALTDKIQAEERALAK